ncbi:glycogen/starch/alpha-glucan phosphorylase [Palleronia sp. LCG004]|uniref:glycogen/starch/alpha-glucan phosphorylase n=1 Tax=Palleronia sp. LCG004 TaxID=3079304 RepID=UPI00294214AE|nr:glycogen/starch/alpha-glucan phosphorylase [Palleronia sp. LCG004]WOI54920.1 glycogen/starch/alpha-glucan phosphorylase [Palleronia sp. LCG004]
MPILPTLRDDIRRHLRYSLGRVEEKAGLTDWRLALSFAIRDRIVDPWFASQEATYAKAGKRVYYLSMEFLIGRLLEDAVVNLGLLDEVKPIFEEVGLSLEDVLGDEPDAALGNGGLGRLAACFLESMSTLGCPAFGYGIRYEHGLFRQSFQDGRQVEQPEDWLKQQHAWEFERPDVVHSIGFGGEVTDLGGKTVWTPGESVLAAAFDTPIVGWKGRWANTLRLWAARPVEIFDLDRFNAGDYYGAAEPENLARTISRVLYPDDTTEEGKRLRLKQEFFFTAASLRDIVQRFESEYDDLSMLPQKVAIQLNDTHPAIAGPELVRILADEKGMDLAQAINVARECLSYTNHTLLPEALERWSRGLMMDLLPRHFQLIEQIDRDHAANHPDRAVAMLGDGDVLMGPLAFTMAHKVNGVSALHTDLMKDTVFAELHRLHPDRIVNQTNGVTPRRWLLSANPRLSSLITEAIGPGWIDDLEQLQKLEPMADDSTFREAYASAKRANKADLANYLGERGTIVDPDAMFDVQIKRIHEYKRQHLNILETIAIWQDMKDNPGAGWTPRVKIFGGKAAPGYVFAKQIIHLINAVSEVVNADPDTRDLLKVAYPANYNVTLAERLIPAAELSEQISTAGKEASGTGNMKFALNGALTIGTLDGANVEIRDLVGAENFFLFGMQAPEVVARRGIEGHARQAIDADPRLKRALDAISTGTFGHGFEGIVSNISEADYFLVASDFTDFHRAQREVDAAYADQENWNRMAILNTARSGWFSSDRTIRGYMRDVWRMETLAAE